MQKNERKSGKLSGTVNPVAMYPLVLSVLILSVSCVREQEYVSVSGYAQGGTYIVKLNLKNSRGEVRESPGNIKEGIDSIILAVDNSLSGYNGKSLLTRFNNGERIVPDSIFMDIYGMSYRFFEETGGAFDTASGPLFDIWGFGFKEGSLPSDAKVAEVMSRCGMDRLDPDMADAVAEDGTLALSDLVRDGHPALPGLNYNAIAQGYTCDLIARYLYSIGVEDMLVDIGGEIYCDGLNPSGKPWIVGVDRPVDGNNVPGAMLEGTLTTDGGPCGIVTSGNYRKYYIKDGKKYAHTIDPRTGYPAADSLLSATVIARDAATADALATYCMVIGYEKAKEFIQGRPDLKGYLIYARSIPQDSGTSDAAVSGQFGTWLSD